MLLLSKGVDSRLQTIIIGSYCNGHFDHLGHLSKKILMIKTVESYGTPRNIFESPHLETVNVKKKVNFLVFLVREKL